MKKSNCIIFVFCFVMFQSLLAQDKLFLRNNTIIKCKISSINEKTVSYKDSAAAVQITTISKEEIIMAEYKSGEIYVFGKTDANEFNKVTTQTYNETSSERKARKMQEWKKEEEKLGDNIIGFYPTTILFGRFAVSYERLFSKKNIGIKLPLMLTYDSKPIWSAFIGNSTPYTTGFGYITGIDLSFYNDLLPKTKYFFGPRIRYGKDIFLELEGFTAQIQNGILRSRGEHFTSTFAVGFGVSKIATVYGTTAGSGLSDQKIYPSFSVTWRLGFRL